MVLFLLMFFTLFMVAEEEFDSFDDEETAFVIKTKKPKILVKKDSTEEKDAVKFSKASVGENQAISMSVKNFLVFSKLKEINARYLVLNLELNNILKSQKVIVSNGSNHPSSWVNKSSEDYEYKEAIPLYQIPNIKQHLYLRVNNKEEKKIDAMSLLLDKPLLAFNSNQVEVLPKKFREGQLAFRLPKRTKIKQLSLHYYDTKYGNINIPILGEMKHKTRAVSSLSKTKSEKMNDNFSLSVTGYETQDKIGENEAPKDGQFEIVEIDIESKLYALLAFNPSERFYLNIGNTHSVKLHPITQALPMGLYTSASLAPGSNNKFRLAFYVPKGMEKQSRSLMLELKGKDILIPIQKGNVNLSNTVLAKSSIEGTSLTVNAVYSHNKNILIDVTFYDEDDDYATRLHNAFKLNDKALKKSNTLFGFKNKEVILNNSKKRVLLWFDAQFDEKKPLHLTSTIFELLNFKIDKKPEALPENLKYFLTKNYNYQHKLDAVDRKVLAMVKTFKAKKSKEEKAKTTKRKQHVATLESIKEKSKFISIPALSASAYGEEKIAKLQTVDELIEALKTLEWVPSAYKPTTAIYSTPAIFTQGWSSENEMFKAIYNRVKEKGVQFGFYTLSEAGEQELKVLAKNIPMNKNIPFIEWIEEGKNRSLVLPFLKPLDEVKKYVTKKQYLKSIKEKQATIEMKLTYTPKNDGSSVGSFGMFGGALNGAKTTEKTNIIFKKSWNLDEISDTPVDIFFPETTAFYTDNNGTHQDTAHGLSTKKIEPKVLTINITMPDGKLDTYEHHFQKKQELKDVFFTFALATPDMPKGVIEKMEEKRKALIGNKDKNKIDPLNKLQWSNRVKIYKFTALQTQYEQELQKTLKVQAYRNKRPRIIMSMLERRSNKQLLSYLDLRRVYNDVYGTEKAIHSFNIMSGIFNAKAENTALPNGKNITSYWLNQVDSNLVLISPENKKEVINIMQKNKIDIKIITRLKTSNKIWLYPLKIKKDIGWLEINPHTYETNSVYENGMYGVAERSEMDMAIDSVSNYFVGFFSGVLVSQVSMFDTLVDSKDYCDNVKQAKVLANNASCLVAVGTTRDVAGAISAGTGCFGHSKTSKAIGIGGGMAGNKTTQGKIIGGIAGFGNGFGDGVSFYFEMAEKYVGNCS
ncbi:MAG: Permeases of the major facilitator superfamily [uncultured Sulfurovum sp.]|uniref:Permeases of the major facilitator superfamily n=1 Tax=uncultured Sulfurovum sp. TaxID=269237 RepID=A0A6S6TGZ0_9BACT|nr:MAG: Permeases of the major facilitator superfamily [uncultured Sulfurovum sp.]